MKYTLLIVITLFLISCAHISRYSKPGATQQEFMKDRYQCLQESRGQRPIGTNAYTGNIESGSQYDWGLYNSCMSIKGYTKDDNGNLFPPKEAVVR